MSLDISFFKASRKEWNEYSKGNEVDIYDTMDKSEIKEARLTYVGSDKKCPDLVFVGYFTGGYELKEGFEKELHLYEYPMERVEELYEKYKYDDCRLSSWLLMALNTFKEDDVLLMYYY